MWSISHDIFFWNYLTKPFNPYWQIMENSSRNFSEIFIFRVVTQAVLLENSSIRIFWLKPFMICNIWSGWVSVEKALFFFSWSSEGILEYFGRWLNWIRADYLSVSWLTPLLEPIKYRRLTDFVRSVLFDFSNRNPFFVDMN